MADELMTIGELAERAQKSPRAVRLYEEMGLLRPRCRTTGNYREYGREALVRLAWIGHLVDLGLPLAEVRSIADSVGDGANAGQSMASVRERYSEILADVSRQIERLSALRDGLVESLVFLEECAGCDRGSLPIACEGCERHGEATAPEFVAGAVCQIAPRCPEKG